MKTRRARTIVLGSALALGGSLTIVAGVAPAVAAPPTGSLVLGCSNFQDKNPVGANSASLLATFTSNSWPAAVAPGSSVPLTGTLSITVPGKFIQGIAVQASAHDLGLVTETLKLTVSNATPAAITVNGISAPSKPLVANPSAAFGYDNVVFTVPNVNLGTVKADGVVGHNVEVSLDTSTPALTADGFQFTSTAPLIAALPAALKFGALLGSNNGGPNLCVVDSSGTFFPAASNSQLIGTMQQSQSAAAPPSITLNPSTNVANNSVVTVSGNGFPANKTVSVLECSGTSGASQCDASTLNATATTNGVGAFSNVAVKVHTGTFGGVACAAGGTCYISAATSSTPSATEFAVKAFTFAKSAASTTTTTTTTAAALSTKTTAAVSKGKIHGKVKAGAKGVAGLKLVLAMKAKGKWKSVAKLTTKSGGTFTSAKLKKSGSYRVTTPKQSHAGTNYGASSSKTLKVKTKT